MMRTFVGIALPDDVAWQLEAVQIGLPVGRPVPFENLHITLAFLGNQQEPVVEETHHALEGLRAPPLRLTIEGLGMFGEARPRSLHAVVRPDRALSRLRQKVLSAARQAGLELPRERFVPHVTLARFGADARGEALADLRAFLTRRVGLRAGPFAVDRIWLYQSHLGQAGAIYEPLVEYHLDAPVPEAAEAPTGPAL